MTRRQPMTLQLQQQWRKDGATNQLLCDDDHAKSDTPKTDHSERTSSH